MTHHNLRCTLLRNQTEEIYVADVEMWCYWTDRLAKHAYFKPGQANESSFAGRKII